MENESKVRKRGRPIVSGDGNPERLNIRIGKEEMEALEHMSIESDKNKSELIRRAIKLYYRMNYGRW